VRLSHVWSGATPRFDDENLVSFAGLVPVMALAERAGLSELISACLGRLRDGGRAGSPELPSRRTAVAQMRLVCGAGSGVFPKGGVTAAGELVGTGTCRACAKTRPATPTSTASPDIYDTPTDRAPS